MAEREPLDRKLISAILEDDFPLGPIIIEERLESTNTTLLEAAQNGAVEPGAVLVAEVQTAGRGRMKRRWISEPGNSLTFSLLVPHPMPERPGFLSVGTALALSRAIEECVPNLSTAIKWPNDVYIGAAKVAGVLAEALVLRDSSHVVIGIGLNVNTTPKIDNRYRSASVISIREAAGRSVDRSRLLATILLRLREILDDLREERGAEVVAGLRRRSFLLGKAARFTRSQREYFGLVIEHTDHLGVVLETEQGQVSLPAEGTQLVEFFSPSTKKKLSPSLFFKDS